MQADGHIFSVDDMIHFATACISNQISVKELLQTSRLLTDDSSFHCAAYSTVNTANATASNLPECQIPDILPGTTILISDCSSSCVGDQYLRLYDYDANTEISFNDDGKIMY